MKMEEKPIITLSEERVILPNSGCRRLTAAARYGGVGLDRGHFFRLRAFLALRDVEANFLPFIQRFVAAAYDVAEVHEYVRA